MVRFLHACAGRISRVHTPAMFLSNSQLAFGLNMSWHLAGQSSRQILSISTFSFQIRTAVRPHHQLLFWLYVYVVTCTLKKNDTTVTKIKCQNAYKIIWKWDGGGQLINWFIKICQLMSLLHWPILAAMDFIFLWSCSCWPTAFPLSEKLYFVNFYYYLNLKGRSIDNETISTLKDKNLLKSAIIY